QRVLGIVENLGLLLLIGGVLDRDLPADLGRDQLDLFVAQRLGRRPHLAETHQERDDVRHRDAERLREVADADAGLDGDGTGLRRRGRARLAPLAVLARLPLLARRPGASLVDDDATAPATGTTPAARAERAVRSVSSVS